MDEFDKIAEQMERKLNVQHVKRKDFYPETYTAIPSKEFISDSEKKEYEWKLKGDQEIHLSQNDIYKYGFNFPYKKRINN